MVDLLFKLQSRSKAKNKQQFEFNFRFRPELLFSTSYVKLFQGGTFSCQRRGFFMGFGV